MSHSDTTDSDHGIRYKTENIRYKEQSKSKYSFPSRDSVKNNEKFSSHKHSRKKFKRDETESSSDDEYYKYRSRENRRKVKNYEESKLKSNVSKRDNSDKSSKTSNVSFGPALPPHLKSKSNISNSDVKDVSNLQIGPSLPISLGKNEAEINISTETISENEDIMCDPLPGSDLQQEERKTSKYNPDIIGPELPSKSENKAVLGPALPPLLQKNETEMDSEEGIDPFINGPSLPPHLRKHIDPKASGNSRDPDLVAKSESDQQESTKPAIVGPVLPDHLRQKLLDTSSSFVFNEEEEDIYGPLPEGANFSKAHQELEERALQMRIDQLNPSEDHEPTREEWMIELPAVKRAIFGLGPRSFKTKTGPDFSDRSSWTDTAQDKASKKPKSNKIDLKEETRLNELHKRDKEQEEIIKKHKKRKESLLDLHTKKLKTKKDNDGSSERRPFSRDIDLQVNRFDEAQKKAVLKKAQLLDDRFSSGEGKFL